MGGAMAEYFDGHGWLERHHDANDYAAMMLHVQLERRQPVVLNRIVVDPRESAAHDEAMRMLEETARYAERF